MILKHLRRLRCRITEHRWVKLPSFGPGRWYRCVRCWRHRYDPEGIGA